MDQNQPALRGRLLRTAVLGLGAMLASTGACSLINSFADVKQSGAGGGGGGGGAPATSSSTTTSSTGSGGSTTTSSSATTTTGSTGGGGGSPTTSSTTGSGGNAGGGGSAPTHFPLLAVSATDTTTPVPHTRVLAVLDAATGNQLSREDAIAPAAIVYDPATSLWYIFDADNFPPIPSHPMTLRVGTIDDTTGTWHEIKNVTTVPILQAPTAGALNGRIVYRAYNPTDSTVFGFAYLDTSHLGDQPPTGPAPSAWGDFQAESTFGSSFFDFIPTPGSGRGGQVSLLSVDCTVTPCDATREVISVPSNGGLPPTTTTPNPVFQVPHPVNFGSVSVAAASARRNSPLDVLVFPDPAEAPSATSHTIVRRINQSNTILSPEIRLVVDSAQQYVGIAIAECENVVIVSEFGKKQAYAIPFDNAGTPDVLSLDGNLPVSIVFEPITKRAFMPFRGTTPALGAYKLDATNPLVPTLAKLEGAGTWLPPAELSVDLVVAAQPAIVSDGTCN